MRLKVAADIWEGVRRGQTPDAKKFTLENLERLEEQGDLATARYRVELDGKPAILIVRLARRERGWQVIAVENAEELYRQAITAS